MTGIHQGAVGGAIGDVVEHEEGTTPGPSPHLRFHQAGLPFAPRFTGHQETEIPFQIFVGSVVIQFQGTGRIHFAPHQLLDLTQAELLEGKGWISHIAVVGQGMQQAHHQPIGDASLVQIAFVEFQLIGSVRKHANLTAHRRVLGHFASGVSRGVQGLVQGRRQGQLTEVKGHLQILGGQTSVQGHPVQKEVRAVEHEAQLDFHPGHQRFVQMEQFRMRFEDQGAHGPALVRDLFFFGQEDGRFLGATEGRIMGVRGGLVHVVGRQGGGKIQSGGHHGVLGGEPALRSQEGVGFLGVVIEEGFQIRFVGITVVLRADEGAVQVTGQLLDEGVGQIVGRVQHVTGVYIGAILFPQTQLHGKITATQIDEGIHTWHHKFQIPSPISRTNVRPGH